MLRTRTCPRLTDGCIDLHQERVLTQAVASAWGPSREFRISLHGGTERIGAISLRLGNADFIRLYAGHIGYGILPQYRGRRYAARACRLLRGVALEHGLTDLWITCNPENLPSRRTCEIIGARFVEIVNVPADTDLYRRGERKKCRYLWQLITGEQAVAGPPREP